MLYTSLHILSDRNHRYDSMMKLIQQLQKCFVTSLVVFLCFPSAAEPVPNSECVMTQHFFLCVIDRLHRIAASAAVIVSGKQSVGSTRFNHTDPNYVTASRA